jgi:hypothetical protein
MTAVFVLLLLTGSTVFSDYETGGITGIVVDIDTGDPVAGATIVVEGTQAVVSTDTDGLFQLYQLSAGDHRLVVNRDGYLTTELGIRVEDGRVTWVTIRLERDQPDSDERETTRQSLSDLKESNYKQKKDESGEGDHMFDVGGCVRVEPPPPAAADRVGISAPKIGIPVPVPDDIGYDCRDIPWRPYDMYFRDYGTNRFVDTRHDRFSTFAVDVDDASYNVAREYLLKGSLPPREAIRIEEFINHFDYGYNYPKRKKFRVFHELTSSPFTSGTMLKIGIKGQEISRRERKPLNLTFVIDVSGSMGYDNRMELVKESLRMLVDQMRSTDRIGIVSYGDNARQVLEPISADRRDRIFRAISGLRPGGSTYAEAGLKLGYEMANRQYAEGHVNRVILCSDGVANVGKTSPEAIMRDIKSFANRGLSLSTFGYGMGNYNDVLLEQLAQKGNGNYAYVNDRDEARKLFVAEFVSNMELLARDVKVQVEFNPDVVSSYRLLGYENRDVADHRFRDNGQDGGEVGAGH